MQPLQLSYCIRSKSVRLFQHQFSGNHVMINVKSIACAFVTLPTHRNHYQTILNYGIIENLAILEFETFEDIPKVPNSVFRKH